MMQRWHIHYLRSYIPWTTEIRIPYREIFATKLKRIDTNQCDCITPILFLDNIFAIIEVNAENYYVAFLITRNVASSCPLVIMLNQYNYILLLIYWTCVSIEGGVDWFRPYANESAILTTSPSLAEHFGELTICIYYPEFRGMFHRNFWHS